MNIKLINRLRKYQKNKVFKKKSRILKKVSAIGFVFEILFVILHPQLWDFERKKESWILSENFKKN
jgi:hypothetical protein